MAYKLLVIDDNQGCSDLYKMRFEMAGFEVAVVFTAEDALEKLKIYRPDAILLDLMLPKMQGQELLKILKSNPETKDIVVIILTAINLSFHDSEDLLTEADDCISKIEILPRELVTRVSNLLENKNKQKV